MAVASWQLLATPCQARISVTGLELRLHAPPRITALDTAVIEVVVMGERDDGNGRKSYGRLRRSGFRITLNDADAGWLSKPFRCRDETRSIYLREDRPGVAAFLSALTKELAFENCVLYTAPEAPGTYKAHAVLGGRRAEVTIEVVADAETVSFSPESTSRDRFHSLAVEYAPFIAQETWFEPKADFITRFDFDGDWDGSNNWESLGAGTSQAYVYYAAMETSTHWFLIYTFFHPRDYSDQCLAGTCHENDNEGVILTVRKDGSEFGRLQVMETLAHNHVYSFVADNRIEDGIHDVDGELLVHEGSHPMVFIEAGGHGALGVASEDSLFSAKDMDFRNTGVTYVYKGVSERPRHANDRSVGYELLPIYEHLWKRAQNVDVTDSRTFTDFFEYEPFGERPTVKWNVIGGAFYGSRHGENKAKPFWGWHDERTKDKKVLSRGQWGLDPAYAVSQNLRFPIDEPFSLEYVYNPYLGIGEP
jgi:hypothetical protein